MKKILIATAVMALPLTACGTVATEQQTANPITDQPVVIETVAVNADTMLDQQIFEDASHGDDASKCDAIVNEDMKKECGQIVNAGLLTKDAIEKRDKSVCGGIELDRYKEQCEVGVDEKVEADEKEAKIEKELNDSYIIETDALKKMDSSICSMIKDIDYKNRCIFNVDGGEEI